MLFVFVTYKKLMQSCHERKKERSCDLFVWTSYVDWWEVEGTPRSNPDGTRSSDDSVSVIPLTAHIQVLFLDQCKDIFANCKEIDYAMAHEIAPKQNQSFSSRLIEIPFQFFPSLTSCPVFWGKKAALIRLYTNEGFNVYSSPCLYKRISYILGWLFH